MMRCSTLCDDTLRLYPATSNNARRKAKRYSTLDGSLIMGWGQFTIQHNKVNCAPSKNLGELRSATATYTVVQKIRGAARCRHVVPDEIRRDQLGWVTPANAGHYCHIRPWSRLWLYIYVPPVRGPIGTQSCFFFFSLVNTSSKHILALASKPWRRP
jgi:hypothetical protein